MTPELDSEMKTVSQALRRGLDGSIARANKLRSRFSTIATNSLTLAHAHRAAWQKWLAKAEAGIDYEFMEGGNRFRVPLDEAERRLYGMFNAIADSEQAAARMRSIDAMLKKYAGQVSADGPTIEMIDRMRESHGDPVQRLYLLGHLGRDECRSAREIAKIFIWLTSRLQASTMRMPYARTTGGTDDAVNRMSMQEAQEWYNAIYASVYVPWSRVCREDAPLVLAMAVEGQSIKELRRRHGGRWETVLNRISTALWRYEMLRAPWKRQREADGAVG